MSVLQGVTSGTTARLVAHELLIALGIDAERAQRMVEAAANQQKPDEPEPERHDMPATPLETATKSAVRESVRVWLSQNRPRKSVHTSNGKA
jgi:hypothetical protein